MIILKKENKIVDCFPDKKGFRMNTDKDWVALVALYCGTEENNKVMLRQDESHRQEAEPPDAEVTEIIQAIALDLPFLVVLSHSMCGSRNGEAITYQRLLAGW